MRILTGNCLPFGNTRAFVIIFALFLPIPCVGAQYDGAAGDYYDDSPRYGYKKDKSKLKPAPFKSIRRWRKKDNWRKWRREPFKDGPWSTLNDAITDVTSNMMGDIVLDIDFDFYVKMNFDADGWLNLDKKDKYKVYKHWKHEIEPYYDNSYELWDYEPYRYYEKEPYMSDYYEQPSYYYRQ